MRRISNLILALVALITLAGCTVTAPPPPATSPLILKSGAIIGQSFVARDSGLDAITLQMAPQTPGSGHIALSLRESPSSPELLTTADVPVSAVAAPGPYRFALEKPLRSNQSDYYLQIEVRGEGSVQVITTPSDSYVDGNLYTEGAPHTGDLVFQPGYDMVALSGDWARRALWCALVGLAAAIILVLPGLALLEIGWDGVGALPMATRLCVGMGMGVAFAPLPMLWTNAVGLHPGAWHVWLPGIVSAAVLLWRWSHRRGEQSRGGEVWEGITLGVVAIALLAVRLAPLSQIEVPLWGDSYHHAMIAQLIIDNGGLFQSWQPYVPYTTLTVQYGFPAISAMFAWVLGGNGVSGTLVAGQVLNATAALSLYPLARRMSGDRPWAGVAAVVVAGLLSPLPGYYVNWGRYAQLAGQVALPTVLWLTWAMVDDAERPWKRAVVLAVTVTGMALSYYRMAFLYAPFVLLLLLIVALPRWMRRPALAIRDIGGLALAGLMTVIFFLPWAINVAGSSLSDKITDVSSGSVPLIDVVRADYNTWLMTPSLIPWYLLALGGLGALAGLAARRWMLAALIPWVLMVAAIVAGRLIGLPGAGLMQSFAVIIALYIPISLVCGWLFSELAGLLARRAPAAHAITAALALALAAAGLPQHAAILIPASVIVSHPDIEAMRWVEANTPTDARFLVNGFSIYGGTSAVGADAGWWMPMLAHRANTMPPQYALLNEQPDPANYTRRVVDLVNTLEQVSATLPEGLRAICADKITHVYIGQGQGAVGAAARPLLDPASLRANPAFQLIYQRDLVQVFKLRRGYCGAGT
ncbi:hypothetical protein EKD04_005780 [Chloroflexales bacterium ZM16-3]|nr:hypothetical protein [Chloroflexales bacterium ZM16-3]